MQVKKGKAYCNQYRWSETLLRVYCLIPPTSISTIVNENDNKFLAWRRFYTKERCSSSISLNPRDQSREYWLIFHTGRLQKGNKVAPRGKGCTPQVNCNISGGVRGIMNGKIGSPFYVFDLSISISTGTLVRTKDKRSWTFSSCVIFHLMSY